MRGKTLHVLGILLALEAWPAGAAGPALLALLKGDRVLLLRVEAPGAIDQIRLLLPGDVTFPAGKVQREGEWLVVEGFQPANPLYLRLELPQPLAKQQIRLRVRQEKGEPQEIVAAVQTFPAVETDLSTIVLFPRFVQPGEEIEIGLLIGAAPGTWTVGGTVARPTDHGTLRVRLPEDLRPSTPLEMVYQDPWGEKELAASAAEQIRVVPPDDGPYTFALCGSPRTGSTTCLCGRFPPEREWTGLRLDGGPVTQPLAVSRRSVCLRLGPGKHRIEAAAGASFAATAALDVESVHVTPEYPPLVVPGQHLDFRWTAAGTTEPVEIRITNATPQILRLEGGDTQVVRTSGGSPNGAQARGIAQQTGRFHLVYAYPANPALGSSARALEMLTPLFQREVKRIAQDLARRLDGLPVQDGGPGGPVYEASRVAALLAASRDDLHASLPYPELAPFRAYADTLYARAREELELDREAAARTDGVRLAAWRPDDPAGGGEVSRASAGGVLKWLSETLSRLADRGTTRRLHVQSSPAGAAFAMHPPSYAAFEIPLRTNSSQCHVPLGRYQYEVKMDGFHSIAGTVDVISDEQEVFDCALKPPGAGTVPPCTFQAGRAEDCP